jgi:hypothetical protein
MLHVCFSVRSIAAVACGALAIALLTAVPAGAAPVAVGADAGTWQVDGRVDAVAYNGDASVAYLAGTFHHMCPPTDTNCTATTADAVAIDNLAAIDVATGAPITAWRPQPDGEVSAIAVAGNNTLYLGGYFNHVSGKAHHRLAALTLSTGQAVATWKPNVSAQVKAIALSPAQDVVYLGGVFKTVNATPRALLAAVSAYTQTTPAAQLLPWDPEPSGTDTIDKGSTVPAIVNSLVVRNGDGEVFAGGVFTTIGGLARSNVAGLQPATGSGTGAADASFSMTPSLHYVTLNVMLTRDGTTLFADGRGPGGFLRAFDSGSGTQLWARRMDGDVQAAVATDTEVYVGGHFDNVVIPGTTLTDLRHHLAAFDAATGATDPTWDPTANSVFGVYGMAWSPGHVLAGGDFTTINRVPHGGVAQFSGGDVSPPTPIVDAAASSTFKGRVDLTWTPATDPDSPTVTYRVYRRPVGGSFLLVGGVAGPTGGNTPITWSDASAPIGSSYEYQVRAADPVFLSPPGDVAGPVTVVGDLVPPAAPTNVSAAATAPGTAQVTWTGSIDADDTALTYTVQRHIGASTVTAGTVVGPTNGPVSFTDTFAGGGTATYTVTADDGTFTSSAGGPSAAITVAADVATPSVPGGPTVTSPSANTMQVTWSASTDADTPQGVLTYSVYRKLSSASGTGSLVATTAPGVTTFTDSTSSSNGALPDKTYTYYVAASDGPLSSAKSSGVAATVTSTVLSEGFSSLAAWTLPAAPSGVSLDPGSGHLASPSVSLVSAVSPRTYGYAHRAFGAAYPTVCVLEWVSVTAYDTRGTGQTTLMRLYSSAGSDIARLYVDGKGLLWVRSDWGSNPTLTKVTVAADGSWHSAQLCVTTTPDSVSGSLSAWWDNSALGTITGVDNSPGPLASMDIGDTGSENFAISVDDVSVGTTKR